MKKHERRPKGMAPWQRDLPEAYREEERLDGLKDIARYLGISTWALSTNLLDDMKESGIIFRRKGSCGNYKVKAKYFTYKRLLLTWLIKRKEI